MRFVLAIVFALVSTVLGVLPASANTCTVPNSLTNGQVVDATALNNNFISLQSCGNNIDSTNIGPAGILASQIIATSAAAGTFGGTLSYTFPNGLTIGAPGLTLLTPLAISNGGTGSATQNFVDITSAQSVGGNKNFTGGLTLTNALGVRGSYVPPLFTTAGAAISNTTHSVFYSGTLPASSSLVVVFSGNAIFTATATYGCTADISSTGSVQVPLTIQNQNSQQVVIYNGTATAYSISGVCTGY